MKEMIVLIVLWELLNLRQGKLRKVMESHRILKTSKSMNPATVNRYTWNVFSVMGLRPIASLNVGD